MRKLFFVVVCLVVMAAAAMAQTKIDTKWTCTKPSENPKFDAGDAPDHGYGLAKGTCNATSGGSGEKSGAYTETQEMWKTSMKSHGTFNVTLDNGDMLNYAYDITGSMDMKKPMQDKWKIVGGTGKHKGSKGTGTCTGMANEDGSSTWSCTGTTSMGAKAAAKAKAKD